MALCLILLSACGVIDYVEQQVAELVAEQAAQQLPEQYRDISFAQARAGFSTTLIRNVNSQYRIPEPPQGVFDLVHFESDVGPLAAFVSSNPGDGERHPLIIWVVGGWSNGISDLPWSYGAWDNDQTAAAFREAGILMMYPSFRGANGNPGYFEALYGEVDDIAAAFEFAAALPYVDPERIYLGGHSTGGTRVLLAAAYTDVFRAVFSFGPVDEIGEHNRTQFTFDLRDEEERIMRSPIHWLDDIKTPTFIIEGQDGTARSLRNIRERTTNENVHVYIVEGADHFDVLAPITRLAAQKILADTGAHVNISITDEELRDAMSRTPVSPMPIMLPHRNEVIGVSFLLPFIWDTHLEDGPSSFVYQSRFFDDNFWESSNMFVSAYDIGSTLSAEELAGEFGFSSPVRTSVVNGQDALIWSESFEFDDGNVYFVKMAAFQADGQLTVFEFLASETNRDVSSNLFEQIIYSISFE